MPLIWAPALFGKANLDNMFYPEGIQLSRKQKLSLIWLASNYDPEKYKKIIPARDCEGANIVQICDAIANPKQRHALRLSAQLLLGTVRVYRTKARLVLQLAEQVMLKLSSLLKEASTNNINLNIIGVARSEAITMAEGVFSIIDYSLEPVYYDPQMIMHMNEDDLIFVNGGTPFSSPIKLEKPKPIMKTPQKSPLVVSNRQISITEDLLSPNHPIQIPGEEDLGLNLFGPAQDNFLEDLNFGDERLMVPVFDDENEEDIEKPRYNQEEVDTKKRKLSEILTDELSELGKEMIEDEPVDLDKVLRDVLNMDFPTMELPVIQESPPKIKEFDGLGDGGINVDAFTMEDMEFGENQDTISQGTVPPETTVAGQPIEWDQYLVTPADAIILQPKPHQPAKKRKLQVDKSTELQSQEIRDNLANPENLIKAPMSAGTTLAGAKELVNTPILSDMVHNKNLKMWWENNRKVECNQPPKQPGVLGYSSDSSVKLPGEMPKSPEMLRKHDDTPSSIDIPRIGSSSLRSLERLERSTLLTVNQTPQDDDGTISRGSFDHMVDFDIDDNLYAGKPDSSRMSGIGTLPDIVEVDLNAIPELDPIMEEGDRTLQPDQPSIQIDQEQRRRVEEFQYDVDEEQEEEGGTFTVGDDDENFPKNLKKYRKHIISASTSENHVVFQDLFTPFNTKRRDATLAFYTCLNLNKNSYIWMEQREVFGPITLSMKPTT